MSISLTTAELALQELAGADRLLLAERIEDGQPPGRALRLVECYRR